MSLRREVTAVADILEDPANADKTPEELAEDVIAALDDVRAKSNRLAVVARYTWDGEKYHMAVLGPFSTRAETAALKAGEGFAGSAAHPGHGRFILAPAFANTRDAWAAIKPDRERRAALHLAEARKHGGWNPFAPLGPTCHCGISKRRNRCPVHPDKTPPEVRGM